VVVISSIYTREMLDKKHVGYLFLFFQGMTRRNKWGLYRDCLIEKGVRIHVVLQGINVL